MSIKKIAARCSVFHPWLTVALILLAAFIYRWLHLTDHLYWLDEVYTQWFVNLSFYELWFWMPTFENHSPLYYTLVKLSAPLLSVVSDVPERVFSLLLWLVVAIVFCRWVEGVSQRLSLPVGPALVLASVLIAVHPMMLWYSLEARPYMLYALALLVSLVGLTLVERNPSARRGWVWLCLGVVLTVWCHATGVFFGAVLVGLAFCVVITAPRTERAPCQRLWFISCAVIFLMSLPFVLQLLLRMQTWSGGTWLQPPDWNKFVSTISNLLGLAAASKLSEANIIPWREVSSLAWIVNAGLLVTVWWALQREQRWLAVSLLLCACVVPILTAVLSWWVLPVFLERALLPAVIPFLALLVLSISSLSSLKERYWPLLVGAVLVCQLGLSGYLLMQWGKKEPWAEVIAVIGEHYQTGDLILSFPNGVGLVLDAHLPDGHGYQHEVLLGEFPQLKTDGYYPAGFVGALGFLSSDVNALAELSVRTKGTVFVISRNLSMYDPSSLITQTLTSLRETPNVLTERGNISVRAFPAVKRQ